MKQRQIPSTDPNPRPTPRPHSTIHALHTAVQSGRRRLEQGLFSADSPLIKAQGRPMPSFTFIALTLFIFLAIVGGIIGIILEGQRIPPGTGAHNPATHDTVFPIVGWATLFAIYLLVENVGTQNMTPGFRQQLATLWVLPLNYAALATARLIWRSARRVHARVRSAEPVVWRSVPYL